MKKLLVMLLSYLIIISPIKAFAESNASVETKVIGEIKKGSNIEILIDVKNVDNLYATSIDFIYDTKQLTVESIKPTEYITKNIDNIMELGGEVDKNGNTATYSFTFLGDVDGLKGSGTLVKINAKVLNNDKLSITKDNMKVKLVQKADGIVKNYDYKFIGYNGVNDSSSGSSNGSNTSSNNGGSDNSNTGNNQGNNTSENDGASGNDSSAGNNNNSGDGSFTGNSNAFGNSSSSGSNSSSNEENKNNEDSKKESSISREEDKENKDKTSNVNDSKSEVSKNNIANIVYILIAIGVVGGVGYYYYRFRKNKNKYN